MTLRKHLPPGGFRLRTPALGNAKNVVALLLHAVGDPYSSSRDAANSSGSSVMMTARESCRPNPSAPTAVHTTGTPCCSASRHFTLTPAPTRIGTMTTRADS